MYFLDYNHHLLLDNDEPGRYVKRIAGAVGQYNDDDDKVSVGRFRIFIVDAESACNDETSIYDVFDSDAALVDYFSLYTPDLEFTPEVIKALKADDRWSPNLLVLDRLEIYPEFRGQGAGLRILRSLMRQFAMGCGLIAMKPYPLQFEKHNPAENSKRERLQLGSFDREFEKSLKKLRSHYAELGFVRVPDTSLMVADPQR